MGSRSVPVMVVLAAILAQGGVSVAQSPPPPTPVPPAGSPSPYPSVLETPEPGPEPPRLEAEASALVDLDSGTVLYEDHGGERRPIASVTKIMTALLVLESAAPSQIVTVSAEAASQEGAVLGLEDGERITVEELLFALLLQSANDAAVALSEYVAGSVPAFVALMNERARAMGLHDTMFASPNGLDDAGYSSALDVAALSVEALRQPTLARVVSTRFHAVPSPDGDVRRIQNRNALLWLYPEATGIKTGYTAAAGFCLAASAERAGLRLVAVVLGDRDEAFSEAATLLDHGFAAYERRTVVAEGEPLEPLTVGGRRVPVAAGATLSLLLERSAETEVEVHAVPSLRLPVIEGEEVGTVAASSNGTVLDEVPLVAAGTVRPLPPEDDPWWERLWEAVVGFVRDYALRPALD